MELKRGVSKAMLCGLALALAAPAVAQFSDSYNFLKAVRDSDGEKAMDLLSKPGAPVLNARDPGTGETALHISIKQHADNWVGFLLGKGAQPDLRDREGNTPLHVAALFGDEQAIHYLLEYKAKIDATNDRGETPLILAVQRRDPVATQLLIDAGANPKINDTFAGKSALDYATDDARGAPVLKILKQAKPSAAAKTVAGPVLN